MDNAYVHIHALRRTRAPGVLGIRRGKIVHVRRTRCRRSGVLARQQSHVQRLAVAGVRVPYNLAIMSAGLSFCRRIGAPDHLSASSSRQQAARIR